MSVPTSSTVSLVQPAKYVQCVIDDRILDFTVENDVQAVLVALCPHSPDGEQVLEPERGDRQTVVRGEILRGVEDRVPPEGVGLGHTGRPRIRLELQTRPQRADGLDFRSILIVIVTWVHA